MDYKSAVLDFLKASEREHESCDDPYSGGCSKYFDEYDKCTCGADMFNYELKNIIKIVNDKLDTRAHLSETELEKLRAERKELETLKYDFNYILALMKIFNKQPRTQYEHYDLAIAINKIFKIK